MKTFADIQQDVLRFFDVASEASDSADVELVKSAINNANQKRVTEDHWKFMLSPVLSLTTVAGQASYILPYTNFHTLQYIQNVTTQVFARELPTRELPAVVESDLGDIYYEITKAGSVVKAQPSTADTLIVTSTMSEAGELYIEGTDADGDFITESIGAGDTTTQTFATVTYYAKTTAWSGLLTLSTTGGDALLTLTADEAGKQYAVLTFTNAPAVSAVWYFRFWRTPRVMVRDLDRPDLPFPESGVLIYDALLDLATYNELDSESVNIWRSKQQEYLNILYLHKLTTDTIGGVPFTIND